MKKSFMKAARGGMLAIAGLACLNFSIAAAPAQTTAQAPQVIAANVNAGEQVAANPFVHPTLASHSTKSVGARMVVAFDVSGSIDQEEYEAQREAMAEALGSEDFQNAVFYPGGPESIAICITEFDDQARMRIGWVDIRKGEEYKFALLAQEVRNLQRMGSGSTSQVRALEYAKLAFDNAPWKGDRNIVNVITDGRENQVYPAEKMLEQVISDLAINYEATVNAFVTTTPSENQFKEWAEENLTTQAKHLRGDGSFLEPGFVEVVATQESARNPNALVKYKDMMRKSFRDTIHVPLVFAPELLKDRHLAWFMPEADKPHEAILPASNHTPGMQPG